MKQSDNYQLHLWEAEDRIEMEKFNENTREIDRQLKAANEAAANLSLMTKIKDYTPSVSGQPSQVHLDLTDIDWSQWQFVCIDVYLSKANTSGSSNTASIGFNGGSSSGTHSVGGSTANGFMTANIATTGTANTKPTRLMLCVMQNPANFVRGLAFCEGNYLTYCTYGGAYSSLQKLTAGIESGGFASGTKFTVWGIQ